MPPSAIPPPNSTFSRTALIEVGNAFNFMQAPLELSTGYDTGTLIVSGQFLALPIILLVAGVIAFLTLVFVHMCSWLFCCECKQKVLPVQQVEVIKDAVHNYQNCCNATFYTVCLYMILVLHLIVYRRAGLLEGMDSSLSFADFIMSEVSNMQTAASTVKTSVALMVSDVQQSPASCIGKNLTSAVMRLQSEASDFSSALDPLKAFTGAFYVNTHGFFGSPLIVELSVWSIYVVPLLCALSLVYLHWYRSELGVKLFLVGGSSVYLGMLAASFCFLGITMILANVCMDPLVGFVKVAPSPLRPTITYYSSCFGVNPLFNHTSYALKQLNAIDLKYNSSCNSASKKIASFMSHKTAARQALLDVSSAVSCPKIRKSIASFINNDVCGNFYNYTSNVWFTLQSASMFMFLLFIIGVSAYRYEDDDHIDHYVDTHFHEDHAHSYQKFKNTGLLPTVGGGSPRRLSAKVSDFGDEAKSEMGRPAMGTSGVGESF